MQWQRVQRCVRSDRIAFRVKKKVVGSNGYLTIGSNRNILSRIVTGSVYLLPDQFWT